MVREISRILSPDRFLLPHTSEYLDKKNYIVKISFQTKGTEINETGRDINLGELNVLFSDSH